MTCLRHGPNPSHTGFDRMHFLQANEEAQVVDFFMSFREEHQFFSPTFSLYRETLIEILRIFSLCVIVVPVSINCSSGTNNIVVLEKQLEGQIF